MFLVDTNIWISASLSQGKFDDSILFLSQIPSDQLALSLFSFHGVQLILSNKKQWHTAHQFLSEFQDNRGPKIISINLKNAQKVIDQVQEGILDFDDAYQYVVAKTENLHLVSFDQDFDKTDIKRLEPLQAIELWRTTSKS